MNFYPLIRYFYPLDHYIHSQCTNLKFNKLFGNIKDTLGDSYLITRAKSRFLGKNEGFYPLKSYFYPLNSKKPILNVIIHYIIIRYLLFYTFQLS